MGHRALLPLLGLLVAGGVLFALSRRADDAREGALMREASQEAPVIDTEEPEGELIAPLRSEGVRSGAGESRPEAPEPAPAPAQFPGFLRVEGRIEIPDGAPLPVGVVRVRLDDDEGSGRLVGEAPVRGSAYWFDVPRGILPADEFRYISAELIAPGFEVVRESSQLRDESNGALRIDLEPSAGETLVRGRVVDGSGAPVPGASVVLVATDHFGDYVESQHLDAVGADGRFHTVESFAAHVEAIAHHQRVGVGRRGARREHAALELDLGDIVLEPLGVVEGVVLGAGDAPLGLHDVTLRPLDDQLDEYEQRSDADGRFRFACLPHARYELHTFDFVATDVADAQVVEPDALGLVLRVPVPSAVITVLDPSGRPHPAADVELHPLVRDGAEWKKGRDGLVTLERDDQGRHHVTFDRGGRWSATAVTYVGDERQSAQTSFEVGPGSSAVTLQLRSEQRVPIELVVTNPDGTPAERWSVSFTDPGTGLRGAYVRHVRPRALITPGTWVARVTPAAADALIRPFTKEVVVRKEGSTVELRAEALGGRIACEIEFADPKRSAAKVRAKPSGAVITVVEGRGPAQFVQAFEAGTYELRVDGSDVTEQAVVREGETTHVRLFVP